MVIQKKYQFADKNTCISRIFGEYAFGEKNWRYCIMFILTAKLSKGKLIGLTIAGGLAVCAIIFAVSSHKSVNESAAPSVAIVYKNIKTNDDRLAFIGSFGWDIKPDPVSVREVLIPQEFDDIYEAYNGIQLEQGLDLQKYRGRRAKNYTYEIKNHPAGQSGAVISLLVYKDRIVGGDVSETVLDGFMHGFKMP